MVEMRSTATPTGTSPEAEASREAGGLATGPRDTVSGIVTNAPAEPMRRRGTETAQAAIDGPRLTPQGRTGEEAADEDETDPMSGVQTGRIDKAEG